MVDDETYNRFNMNGTSSKVVVRHETFQALVTRTALQPIDRCVKNVGLETRVLTRGGS